MGDVSLPIVTLIVVAGSLLPPLVVGEYAQRDVRHESSGAEDNDDLAHRHVCLLAHLPPSPCPRPLHHHRPRHHDVLGLPMK
jgi:hypothetical protein